MKQLMIHVERAVRPIRGEVSTKCRMREELFDHISEIYQQELERDGDEDTAVQRACERFGDPATLRAELQGTVPWLERVAYPLNEVVRRRPAETPLRYAARMAVSSMLIYAVVAIAVMLGGLLLWAEGAGGAERHAPTKLGLGVQTLAALGISLSVSIGLFAPVGTAMRDQLEMGLLRPRSWRTAGVLCLLAAAIVFFCGIGFMLMMPIDGAVVSRLLPRWYLLALVTPLLLAVPSRLAAIEAVRSRPWTSLDISE